MSKGRRACLTAQVFTQRAVTQTGSGEYSRAKTVCPLNINLTRYAPSNGSQRE